MQHEEPASTCLPGRSNPSGGAAPGASRREQPFFYDVAENLHRVTHLPTEKLLTIWRQILDRYAALNLALPLPLRNLCEPPFLESLMEDEIFWGIAAREMGRSAYSAATDHVPAVYATAALLALHRDGMSPGPGVDAILGAAS